MHRIVRPAGWPQGKGYADGILSADGHLFVGGQVGWTPEHVFVSGDFVAQMEQALRNVVAIVEAAGGAPEHIVRLTWYVIDKREYVARQREVGEAYRRVLGRHFPAMALVVVAGLVEDAALVEIEATAVIPKG
ncbi:MAG: RidA family protein [Hyphomicrobiaceae bacterium]|nr:RidA family protein [Hyphomicrobiaceae bacterium]